MKELVEAIKNRPSFVVKIPHEKPVLVNVINTYDEHLDKLEAVVADFQKNHVIKSKVPLQKKYDWWKQHTELDKKSGYPISKERQELLGILTWLLEG